MALQLFSPNFNVVPDTATKLAELREKYRQKGFFENFSEIFPQAYQSGVQTHQAALDRSFKQKELDRQYGLDVKKESRADQLFGLQKAAATIDLEKSQGEQALRELDQSVQMLRGMTAQQRERTADDLKRQVESKYPALRGKVPREVFITDEGLNKLEQLQIPAKDRLQNQLYKPLSTVGKLQGDLAAVDLAYERAQSSGNLAATTQLQQQRDQLKAQITKQNAPRGGLDVTLPDGTRISTGQSLAVPTPGRTALDDQVKLENKLIDDSRVSANSATTAQQSLDFIGSNYRIYHQGSLFGAGTFGPAEGIGRAALQAAGIGKAEIAGAGQAAQDAKLNLIKQSKEILGPQISDADRELLLKNVPGIEDTPDAFKRSMSLWQAGLQRHSIDRNRFLEEYRQRNGSLAGAMTQWNAFNKKYPALDTAQGTMIQQNLDPNLMEDYLAPPIFDKNSKAKENAKPVTYKMPNGDLINESDIEDTIKETGRTREEIIKDFNLKPMAFLSNVKLASGTRNSDITDVVLHHTGGDTLQSAVNALQNRNLSYHYLIDRDGTIHQMVDPSKKAFHAKNFNDNSIGISFVGGTDKSQITKTQIANAQNLIQSIKQNVPTLRTIGGHKHRVKERGRKSDPAGVDISQLALATGLEFFTGE